MSAAKREVLRKRIRTAFRRVIPDGDVAREFIESWEHFGPAFNPDEPVVPAPTVARRRLALKKVEMTAQELLVMLEDSNIIEADWYEVHRRLDGGIHRYRQALPQLAKACVQVAEDLQPIATLNPKARLADILADLFYTVTNKLPTTSNPTAPYNEISPYMAILCACASYWGKDYKVSLIYGPARAAVAKVKAKYSGSEH